MKQINDIIKETQKVKEPPREINEIKTQNNQLLMNK